MADSDSEKEKEVPEVLPPYKIRYNDMDIKLFKEVLKGN